jgi:hypothetical protein
MKSFRFAALAAALLALSGTALAQNAVTLTNTTTINADGTLTPRVSWATTPAATSCTATGDAAWAGNKAASGAVTLAPFPATESRGYFIQCNWPGDTQAALTWVAPTTFEPFDHDNDPATPMTQEPLPKCAAATDTGPCLAGYLIEFGTSPTNLSSSRFHMFPNSTSTPVTGLTPGQSYTFGIRAITGQGARSARSNTVGKTLAATVTLSQSTGIRTPSAPTLQ